MNTTSFFSIPAKSQGDKNNSNQSFNSDFNNFHILHLFFANLKLPDCVKSYLLVLYTLSYGKDSIAPSAYQICTLFNPLQQLKDEKKAYEEARAEASKISKFLEERTRGKYHLRVYRWARILFEWQEAHGNFINLLKITLRQGKTSDHGLLFLTHLQNIKNIRQNNKEETLTEIVARYSEQLLEQAKAYSPEPEIEDPIQKSNKEYIKQFSVAGKAINKIFELGSAAKKNIEEASQDFIQFLDQFQDQIQPHLSALGYVQKIPFKDTILRVGTPFINERGLPPKPPKNEPTFFRYQQNLQNSENRSEQNSEPEISQKNTKSTSYNSRNTGGEDTINLAPKTKIHSVENSSKIPISRSESPPVQKEISHPTDQMLQILPPVLDSFESVGAESFSCVLTNSKKEKMEYHEDLSKQEFLKQAPAILKRSFDNQWNAIFTPNSEEGITFIRLDDIDPQNLERCKNFAFQTIETSWDNYHAWFAFQDISEEKRKSLQRRLKKGLNADKSGSGKNSRMPGSINWKRKTQDLVVGSGQILGLFTSEKELIEAGLIAEEEKIPMPIPSSCISRKEETARRTKKVEYQKPGKFPSYGIELGKAPEGTREERKGKPDRSYADFEWSKLALTWGWNKEEVLNELMRVSERAKEVGRKQEEKLVEAAFRWLLERGKPEVRERLLLS